MVITRRYGAYVVLLASVTGVGWCTSNETSLAGRAAAGSSQEVKADEVAALKKQIAVQQQQIEELQKKVAEILTRLSDRNATAPATGNATVVGLASTSESVSPAPGQAAAFTGLAAPSSEGWASSAGQGRFQGRPNEPGLIDRVVSAAGRDLFGFKLSGDLRFRTDGIFRSGNAVAGPVQNIRERYRLRLNIDRALNDKFDFHLQLGSGTFSNPLSQDTDFTGTNLHGPIFLNEYSLTFRPNRFLELRGGRMEEVFADYSRFEFDNLVRFSGLNEVVKLPLAANSLGLTRFEIRAGQYILTNPNIAALPSEQACSGSGPKPSDCLYLLAGYRPGGRVGSANLFHQGFGIYGNLSESWSQQLVADLQLYRNANQLALARTTAGFPLVENSFYGLSLSGPISGIGTATTQDGSRFWAGAFQIIRLNYGLLYQGWKTSRQKLPVLFDFQGSRNLGTGFARDAFMGRLVVGEVQKAGQIRVIYAFAYKDANSMLSQVTDAKMGTGSGVNIRTHHIRFDIGLTGFLQWQNLFYIQSEIRKNDPARNFYVPLQAGAATQFHIQSQFLFVF